MDKVEHYLLLMFSHRPREIRQVWLWGELEKIARIKNLYFFSVFKNGLAFLGQIGKAGLSEFPEIYDLALQK